MKANAAPPGRLALRERCSLILYAGARNPIQLSRHANDNGHGYFRSLWSTRSAVADSDYSCMHVSSTLLHHPGQVVFEQSDRDRLETWGKRHKSTYVQLTAR